MPQSREGSDRVKAGHGCRRLWLRTLAAPASAAAERTSPRRGTPAPLLGPFASVLLVFALGGAALAATAIGQAHGPLVAAQLPPFLLSDKHPMAFALLALLLTLLLGRGLYLHGALSRRWRATGA